MLQERYNRIILPFFFFTEILFVALIYLFINDYYPKIKFDLLIFCVIWAIPSLYFISYRVVRTHSILEAIQPLIKTIAIFMIIYFIAIKFRLMAILPIDNIIKIVFSVGFTQFLFSTSRFIFFHKYRLNGKNINNVILITPNDESNFTKLKQDILHYGYHINERIIDINQIEKKNKYNSLKN